MSEAWGVGRSVMVNSYLDPGNVHIKDDGSVIANGPHGMEFHVIGIDRLTAGGIERGLLPDNTARLAAWQDAHNGPDALYAQDNCV